MGVHDGVDSDWLRGYRDMRHVFVCSPSHLMSAEITDSISHVGKVVKSSKFQERINILARVVC